MLLNMVQCLQYMMSLPNQEISKSKGVQYGRSDEFHMDAACICK
jgi:hypothetical protein